MKTGYPAAVQQDFGGAQLLLEQAFKPQGQNSYSFSAQMGLDGPAQKSELTPAYYRLALEAQQPALGEAAGCGLLKAGQIYLLHGQQCAERSQGGTTHLDSSPQNALLGEAEGKLVRVGRAHNHVIGVVLSQAGPVDQNIGVQLHLVGIQIVVRRAPAVVVTGHSSIVSGVDTAGKGIVNSQDHVLH
ncbi:MAG: hypothetical protein FRX49_11077 [Trebouxia sp. A1-2]|nr:MAG: hypothetical protein FRX49_11077 [Trebouxia sp. A1-2]